jgi:hypothetical protein
VSSVHDAAAWATMCSVLCKTDVEATTGLLPTAEPEWRDSGVRERRRALW